VPLAVPAAFPTLQRGLMPDPVDQALASLIVAQFFRKIVPIFPIALIPVEERL
jgi:hypothetical protein